MALPDIILIFRRRVHNLLERGPKKKLSGFDLQALVIYFKCQTLGVETYPFAINLATLGEGVGVGEECIPLHEFFSDSRQTSRWIALKF